MKLFPIVIFFGLVGCSGCHSTRAANLPSIDKQIGGCDAVYHHVLELTFDQQVDTEHEFTGEKRDYGIHLLDEQFIASQTRQKFYAFCINRMNEEQMDCAKNASTMADVDTCYKLIPHNGR